MRAEEYQTRTESVGEWKVRLTSYRLGNNWFCVADNVDPGVSIARGNGTSREEAEAMAFECSRERLVRTWVLA
jgi:hypothetical protein